MSSDLTSTLPNPAHLKFNQVASCMCHLHSGRLKHTKNRYVCIPWWSCKLSRKVHPSRIPVPSISSRNGVFADTHANPPLARSVHHIIAPPDAALRARPHHETHLTQVERHEGVVAQGLSVPAACPLSAVSLTRFAARERPQSGLHDSVRQLIGKKLIAGKC